METELARTFLTVVAAGNFISAADRLHVTQPTVSARIRTWRSNWHAHCSCETRPAPC